MFPRLALGLRFRVSVFCTAVRRACITAAAMVMGIHAWSKILFVKDLVSSGRQGGAGTSKRPWLIHAMALKGWKDLPDIRIIQQLA